MEETSLLQRFGANVSVSRKRQTFSQALTKSNLHGQENEKEELDFSELKIDDQKGILFDRLSGTVPKTKNNLNENLETNQSTGDTSPISTKKKPLNSIHLKKLKNQEYELSINGKTKENTNVNFLPENGKKVSKSKRSKSLDNHDDVEMKNSCINQFCQVKYDDEDNSVQVCNENNSVYCDQKKVVKKVKSLYREKKNNRFSKRNSLDETSLGGKNLALKEPDEEENVSRETGIDILERLTKNLNNAVREENSGKENYF